jgi:hypothetical protein
MLHATSQDIILPQLLVLQVLARNGVMSAWATLYASWTCLCVFVSL